MRCALASSFAAALLLLTPSIAAGQRPAIGAPAPLPVVHDLAGSERSLKQLAGRRGLVVLFWAGWSERSIEELRRLDDVAPDMAAHGVTIAAVSVERFDLAEAEQARLRDRVKALNLRLPVLIDRGLELFHAYGVVTIPSTAVVDASGRLSYFLFGYSHEQREELYDAIDAVAGIVRKPALTATLKVAPAALRRVQLGRLQLSQGHEAPARSSFEEAVKADATFPDPLVELAALALDSNDFHLARQLLDRAAALDAGHIGVQRERARLAALTGQIGPAQAALEQLIAKGGDSTTAAYLGYLLQAAGDDQRATTAFDRAKEISGVDPRSYGAKDSSPAGAAAKAMTAYRREVAPGRR
jgi:peroxiredoxin/Flp pilus assembly protein TadD